MDKRVLFFIACFVPTALYGMDATDLGGLAAVSAPCQHDELKDQWIQCGYAQIIGIALLFTKTLQAQLCNSKTDPDAVRVCANLTTLLAQILEKTCIQRRAKEHEALFPIFYPLADIEVLTAWMDGVRELVEGAYRSSQIDSRITCVTTPALFSALSVQLLRPITIVFKPVTEKDILSDPIADDVLRNEAIYQPFKRVAYIRACELLREDEELPHPSPCCIQ